MDGDGRSVYVSVCGHVERVEVAEMSLDGLCSAVSERFDVGHRLRFASDEEGEPVVQTDDHLRRLVHQRQTLRVLMSENALSELEQRMWQLRQLQWGYFQDELARSKNSTSVTKNEIRQLRQVIEQNARREVELAGEIVAERHARERAEAVAAERHEALVQELRREQRARENAEAALRKDLEDARQTSLRLAAGSEREVQEAKALIGEETKNRSRNIEALLAEWASNQTEIRQVMDNLRQDMARVKQEHEKSSQNLFHEASSREAFQKHLGEKVRKLEMGVDKLEGSSTELDGKFNSSIQSIQDAHRSEAIQRAASHQKLQSAVNDLRDRQDRSPTTVARCISTGQLTPSTVYVSSPSAVISGTPSITQSTLPFPRSTSVAGSASAGVRTPPPPAMVSSVQSISSAQTALGSSHVVNSRPMIIR